MSDHSPLDSDPRSEADTARRWTVYRCTRGCFHVALDRLTLTLTEDEFHALHTLMNQAWVRFQTCAPHHSDFKRAH